MKLSRLRLRNFRCYKDEFSVDFDDITALIGLNDSGKSSIMDALDIFLNDGTPDKNDATMTGDRSDLTIILEFEELPIEVILDEKSPTTFAAEHLLNDAGHLEIHKTYSGGAAAPKCTGMAVYCVHPTADKADDLLILTNADLKKRAKEIGANTENVDLKVNAQIRASIRTAVGELGAQPKLLSLAEGNGKKVWDGIFTYTPTFALFKSDRASTDQDQEAQDPLKMAVKEALKEKQQDLDAIVAHVLGEVKKVADKTLEKLKEMDSKLASELNPELGAPKWDGLFKVSITGDEAIPINKRGSGVKRLILLNFFRAKVELQRRDKPSAPVIYGIEEPETSQHPNNQRMLISALMELSADNQVVLTTHTPMLARSIPETSLRYIHVDEDGKRAMLLGSESTNQMIAKTLGVLPDNGIKLFIGVEGVHDVNFLKRISKVLRDGGVDVLDLEQMELNGELIFFPLGGSTLALWSSRLAPLRRPEFHLYDRDIAPPDDQKYKAAADVVNARDGCKAVHTSKREMENYLNHRAVNAAYTANGNTMSLTTQWSDWDDVPALVAKELHESSGSPTPWSELATEARKEKASRVKKVLNDVAVTKMNQALLTESDPSGDVLSWFREMQALAALS